VLPFQGADRLGPSDRRERLPAGEQAALIYRMSIRSSDRPEDDPHFESNETQGDFVRRRTLADPSMGYGRPPMRRADRPG